MEVTTLSVLFAPPFVNYPSLLPNFQLSILPKSQGKSNLKKINNTFFRIGYRSSGAFMVTEYAKLKEDQIVKYAPAYKVHAFANKLDRKDFLGKSGI